MLCWIWHRPLQGWAEGEGEGERGFCGRAGEPGSQSGRWLNHLPSASQDIHPTPQTHMWACRSTYKKAHTSRNTRASSPLFAPRSAWRKDSVPGRQQEIQDGLVYKQSTWRSSYTHQKDWSHKRVELIKHLFNSLQRNQKGSSFDEDTDFFFFFNFSLNLTCSCLSMCQARLWNVIHFQACERSQQQSCCVFAPGWQIPANGKQTSRARRWWMYLQYSQSTDTHFTVGTVGTLCVSRVLCAGSSF